MAGRAEAMLRTAADRTRPIPREFTTAAVATIRKEVEARLARDTGGDMRLSRAGNVPLTVDTEITGGGQTMHASVSAGTPRNQWSWLEEGTKPRRQGRGRHPGTKPRNTWTEAVGPVVPRLVDDAVRRWQQAIGG